MRVGKFALLTVATTGLASTALADGPAAYEQLYGLGTGAPGLFSDAIPGQYFSQQIADDFVLGGDTPVNGVGWVGRSENFANPDLANFSDFRIQIFEDSGFGTPGVAILDLTVPTAATNPTVIETGAGGELIYAQNLKFDELLLTGGDTYYFSVGSVNVDPGSDGYVWANSIPADGNNLVFVDDFSGAGYQPVEGFGDMAFKIQAVPAPGVLALLGVAGIVGRRRRRA